jgi:predicted nucleotidyltransferase
MLSEKYIKKIVKEYLMSLPIKVEFALLFGSSVSSNRLRNSDIDLIVVSNDFKNMQLHERFFILQKFWKHDIDLEAFGYTVEEFSSLKEKSILISEADKKGVLLTTSK